MGKDQVTPGQAVVVVMQGETILHHELYQGINVLYADGQRLQTLSWNLDFAQSVTVTMSIAANIYLVTHM